MKNNLFFKKETKILSKGIVRGVLSLSVASLLLFTSCSKDEVISENPVEQNKVNINPTSTARFGQRYGANSSNFENNFFYSIDKDGPNGSSYIDFDGQYGNPRNRDQITNPGNFTISWSNVKETVGGLGYNNGNDRTINYNVGYFSGEVKFVGVYGWTQYPLTEYYISEMGSGLDNFRDTGKYYDSDGHRYRIYSNYQTNKPSINGIASFWQFQSRWGGGSTGTNGRITLGTHLNNLTTQLNSRSYSATNKFGVDRTGYSVFGCEAYNYNTGSTSGSMNATIW
jgi:endo-1,4-beta-xylanase